MQRPFKVVDTSSGLVTFDGLEAVTWKVLMKQSIAASGVRLKHIAPGQLYSFIFVQDAEGGHSFSWPSPWVKNGESIDRRALTVSVQTFIGNTGGVLIANLPGAWGNP